MTVKKEVVLVAKTKIDKASFRKAEDAFGGVSRAARTALNEIAKVDEAKLTKAAEAIEKIKTKLSALTKQFREGFVLIMSGYALGKVFWSFISGAGGVEETLNALSIAFEENTDSVVQWAQAYGRLTGRSQYALRETAGMFGLIMKPNITDTKKLFEMATGLAERATDMASALQEMAGGGGGGAPNVNRAIVSALTGETETIKRWGVNLKVEQLERERRTLGFKKSYKAMTEAERIELRYQVILRQTTHLLDDATKTKFQYTNTIINAVQWLKEMRIEIGKKITPVILAMINGVMGASRAFEEWAAKSEYMTAIVVTLGIAGTFVAAKMLAAFAPLIPVMLLWAGLLALVVLLIDDFIVFMKDGRSVLGDFLNRFFGKGSADNVRDAIKLLAEAIRLLFTEDLPKAAKVAFTAFQKLYNKIDSIVRRIQDLYQNKVFQKILNFALDVGGDLILGARGPQDLKKKTKLITDAVEAVAEHVSEPKGKIYPTEGQLGPVINNTVEFYNYGHITEEGAEKLLDQNGGKLFPGLDTSDSVLNKYGGDG